MPMTPRILTEPNPLLRRRSQEVDLASLGSPKVAQKIENMKAALSASRDGIGIAAPQIGIPLRVFVVSEEAKFIEDPKRRERENWAQYVYINPVIKKFSTKKTEFVEGCLSVPGKYGI
ncbi:MAG: peptide deformylase, partial [Candidatus Sungbacteria bacterium]|nr:peptide deformylase [Candidatus Sungbacteria bacterium]